MLQRPVEQHIRKRVIAGNPLYVSDPGKIMDSLDWKEIILTALKTSRVDGAGCFAIVGVVQTTICR